MSPKDSALIPAMKFWPRIVAYLDARPERRPPRGKMRASAIRKACPILEYWEQKWRAARKFAKTVAAKEKYDALLRKAASMFRPGGDTQAILDTGTVLHKQVQFYFGVMGWLVGGWRCATCGHTIESADGKPVQMPLTQVKDAHGNMLRDYAFCPECDRNYRDFPPWIYQEPSFFDEETGMTGSTDGLLDLSFVGQTHKGILEVKTINESGFLGKYGDGLPQADHVFQMNLYMHFTKRMWALLIYFNKNKSQTKEFVIKYDPSAWESAKEKADVVKEAKKKDTPPDKKYRICRTFKDKEARLCPMCASCFGSLPPENIMA